MSRLHIMIGIAYIGALNQDQGVVVVTTGDSSANNFQTTSNKEALDSSSDD